MPERTAMSRPLRAALVLLPLAQAFVGPSRRSPLPRSTRRAPVRSAPVAALPAFVAPIAQGASFLASPDFLRFPVMYGLMSVNEYFTHRYYQHAEFNNSPWLQAIARAVLKPFGKPVPRTRGGGHVEHHAETLDDMTLKTDARWRATKVAKSLDDDVYRGTAFTWSVTGAMTIQMLFTTLPVFMGLLRFRFVTTMAILLPGMLVHALVWNALHPNMHALPDVPLRDGAPSWVFAPLRSTWFFRYLYQNHEGHHVAGGQANYNVACPGTDHLVGTYLREKVWRPRATSTYLSHHGEDLSMEQQIANHVAREKFGVKPTPIVKPAASTPKVAFTNQTQVLDLA